MGMANVGFIGLGIMGTPMAGHLIKGGHRVFLHSRRGVPPALTDGGGIACANSADVAQKADIVITMVPDTPQVEDVLFGEHGVAKGLSEGKIVVDMSSISPLATKVFAQKIKARGCECLDAPVSGSVITLEEGKLSIMVGGDRQTFERALPILQAIGPKVTHVGANGLAVSMKIATNLSLAVQMLAFSEGVLLAQKSGIARATAVASPLMIRSKNESFMKLSESRAR